MNGSFKKIMMASVCGMVTYAIVYELIEFWKLGGSNDVETILLKVLVPFAVAIAVIFTSLGVFIKLNK